MSWLTPTMQDLLLEALWQTALMVGVGAAIAVVLGLPIALLLYATGSDGLRPMPLVNRPIGLLVNATRSTPFIILLVAVIPFTRWVVGTSIGTAAAIPGTCWSLPAVMACTTSCWFVFAVSNSATRWPRRSTVMRCTPR